MGKIPQGILGGVSGKIGGVVGSSWKGINVIKTKPLSVANPKTAGQVAQRDKFGNTVAFATQILSSIIKPLWDRFSGQMSGFNKFIQTNIDLFEAENPNPLGSLKISSGRMQSTNVAPQSLVGGATDMSFDWVDDSGSGFKLATDELFIVILNTTTGEISVNAGDFIRSAELATVDFSSAPSTGDELICYSAFRRADGTVVSNTDVSSVVTVG